MPAPHAEPGATGGSGRHATAAGDSSALLISALAGALLGAAGLAWWLLSEAESRRSRAQQQRMLRLSRLQEGTGGLDGLPVARPLASGNDRELHDKVHQLNEAIDDVRRQLEAMATGR